MRFDRGSFLALGILFVAIVTLIYLYSHSLPEKATAETSDISSIKAVFACRGGKSIDATFSDDSVALILSDSRAFTLPHAISADGARYANADESFVFWNKGNGAFILEGGTTTYSDCTVSKNNE